MAKIDTKRILIVAYYWPPAGGPGVQRWLKFVKYLPDYNIEPIVYVPENPSYPIEDQSLLKEIPEGVTILKQPISEPYKWASVLSKKKSKIMSKGLIKASHNQSLTERILLFVRGNFFIPDARRSWVRPSISYLTSYLERTNVDAVITTGPPHSMHLIGLGLKVELGLKWITDFRDPWTTIGYHKKLKLSNKAREKHLKMEGDVLNRADQIIVTSNFTKREFSKKTNVPIEVITNGYDDHKVERPDKASNFVISHIGSLLSDRNPKLLWKALSKLIDENREFKDVFQLNLIGVVSEEVIESLENFNLSNFTKVLGYLDHDQAIKHQMSSSLLLLIEIDSQDTKAIIPGKIFEYMQSGTPILGIGPEDSEIKRLIDQTNTGTYLNYTSETKLAKTILSYFEAYKMNALGVKPTGITQYSRRALTKKLAELI